MATARTRRSQKKRGPAEYPAAREPNSAVRTVLAVALLLVLTIVVYSPVLSAKFIDFDDREGVETNPDFNPPRLAALGHYWVKPFRSLYIPVAYTVWGGIAAIAYGGSPPALDPGVFHVANLLIHLGSTTCVFFLIYRLTRSRETSWLAAALFAVHPVQVEAVAYVTGLYTLLAGFFSLAALWLYLQFSDAWEERAKAATGFWRWIYFAGATLCFALALLSKPSSVVVPAIALALEWLRGRPLKSRLLPVGIWCLMALPLALATRSIQGDSSALAGPVLTRPLVALDALAFYGTKLLVPVRLIPDYGRTPRWLLARPVWFVLGLLPLAAIAWAAIWSRRSRWPLIALAVFVIALLPVLGLVPFYFQRYSTVADRYLYPAMLGPVILLAYFLMPPSRRRLRIVAAAAVCVLGAMSFVQAGRWHDSRTLFEYTTQVNPNSFAANYVLGFVDARDGLAAEARATTDAEHQIARAMVLDAIKHDRAALEAAPDDAQVLLNLGNLYLRTGSLEDAVRSYQHAARSAPPTAQLFNNLGIALLELNRPQEAQAAFAHAIELEPNNADAYANWGVLLWRLQDRAGAIERFKKALSLDPRSPLANRYMEKAKAAR